jgi:predicted transcriptional regulator
MRTLLVGIVLAALLVPLAAAGSVVELRATIGPAGAAPPVEAGTAPPVPDPASGLVESVSPQAPELIEATSLQGGATAPGGLGFSAQAAVDPSLTGARLVDAIVPVVEDHAPEAVAAVGLVALLQSLGVWRFLGLGAFALYSRLTRSELLDNQHRDRVFRLIQEKPGIGVSEIAQATGLGWGTTVYHLDRLERHSFVASERAGLHKCYFPVGTVAREARKGIGALKTDTTRSIAEFLVSKPGATQSELCSALGLSPSAASKQVSKLEQAGLVRRERDWKTVHLFPQESLGALLGPAPAPAPTPAPAVA